MVSFAPEFGQRHLPKNLNDWILTALWGQTSAPLTSFAGEQELAGATRSDWTRWSEGYILLQKVLRGLLVWGETIAGISSLSFPPTLSLPVPCRQPATLSSQLLIPLISLSSEQCYKLAEYLFSPHLFFFFPFRKQIQLALFFQNERQCCGNCVWIEIFLFLLICYCQYLFVCLLCVNFWIKQKSPETAGYTLILAKSFSAD